MALQALMLNTQPFFCCNTQPLFCWIRSTPLQPILLAGATRLNLIGSFF